MAMSSIKSFLKESSARNENGRVLTIEIDNCSLFFLKKSHLCLKTFLFKTQTCPKLFSDVLYFFETVLNYLSPFLRLL